MDSKLVVEQMSGRWKIKHPDMRPLAQEANRLAPFGHDVHLGAARARTRTPTGSPTRRSTASAAASRVAGDERIGLDEPDSLIEEVEEPGVAADRRRPRLVAAPAARRPRWSWSGTASPRTPLEKRFSGGLGERQPRAQRRGPRQVRATADWLSPLAERRRRRDRLARTPHPGVRRDHRRASSASAVEVEPGFAEMEFGAWDGLTFAEVAERHQDDLEAWLGSLDVAAGGRASRSGRSRSGCSPALDRVLRERTPAGPSSWSAT